jgi:hypothetical protein
MRKTKMRLRDPKDVVNMDWPDMPITDRAVEAMRQYGRTGKYSSGDMRVNTGRVYTDAEYESLRTRVQNTPLP